MQCTAMLSFVNPGLLGSLAAFKKYTLAPIQRSRDREATGEEKETGKVLFAKPQHYLTLASLVSMMPAARPSTLQLLKRASWAFPV